MTTSRFESKKPKYQNKQLNAQPPMGSTAVFEWKKFASLDGNYSDANMLEVYKRISSDIIERPYHYHDYDITNASGKLIPTEFTPANNATPPATIKGGALYKRNHGTCHALRQMVYTDKIIDAIAEKGNATGQDLAQKITANDEIKSAIKLAAYCKRIGRTFDNEKDDNIQKGGLRAAHKPTVYSKRSARMFAMIAEELGFSADLIKVIEDSMLEADAAHPTKTKQFATIDGINGQTLRDLSHNVLIAAHRADLTRIFEVSRATIEKDLATYFDKSRLNEVANGIVVMGCEANAMTGNKVIKQEAGVIYNHTIGKDGKKIITIGGKTFTEEEIAATKQKTPLVTLDGKKAVDTAQNLGKTMADLAKLQLIAPAAAKPQLKPLTKAQKTKSIFAFDMDDTLFRGHTFWAPEGPITIKGELATIKAQMAEAIKNGHEVWLVTANYKYTKDNISKLFNPDPDNLLKKIKFYNSDDIEKELNLAPRKNIVHTEGKKAEFLAKKIAEDAELANFKVNCVLFDDTQVQIDKCADFSTDKITITGYRVDEYQALIPNSKRKAPDHNLSEEFANRVKAAGVVAGIVVPNEPAHPVPVPNPAPVPVPVPSEPAHPVPVPSKPAHDKKDGGVYNPRVTNPYLHKASSVAAGRFHFFTASMDDSLPAEIKEKYKGCSGDYLKTRILKDLKSEIQGFTNMDSLDIFQQNLKDRPEYKVLNTAQGIYSRITGKKTSSIEALENMIQQKEDHFKHAPAHGLAV